MQYRAGEGGTQSVAEERNRSPRPTWGYEEIGGETQGQRLGQSEASYNLCGSMRIMGSPTRPGERQRETEKKV